MNRIFDNKHLSIAFLRLGLAFVFLYAGIASLVQPLVWVGFLPGFTDKIIQPELALKVMACFEIALAAWLISGKYRKAAAGLSAVMLAAIILADRNQFIVTFRDVGLLFAALALLFSDT